jgi:hypothetical protein
MSDRFCDKCGAKSSPRMPRSRVGDEMWCGMCAMNAARRLGAVELHPDNVWQRQTFGAHHTTGGRVLPGRHTGATHDEQEARMSDQKGWLHHSSFEPVRFAIEGARSYASKVGLGDPHEHGYDHVRQTADTVRHVGRLYDALPHHDPSAVSHFEAMGKEVGDQYHHLTHTMGVNVQSVDHDPYKNVHEMVNDVNTNKRLQVMGTHVTGGHPFFSDTANDKFRAVHDFFGHAATGRDFDRHGEQAAYLAHSKMFSEHARPALTSETKGQNASLILNGHFGPQKIAVLPRHHWDDSALRGADPRHASLHLALPGEDAVRHETGTQLVHPVGGNEHLCAHHLTLAQSHSDFAAGVAAQAGLPREFVQMATGQPRPGRCTACSRAQHGNDGLPWNSPPGGGFRTEPRQERQPTPHHEGDDEGMGYQQGRFPYRPQRGHERFVAPDTHIQSLNSLRLVTVVTPGKITRIGAIKLVAHDSGDGETIFHCPFCGSGQVLARSDGAVDCEFCQTAFTVQVQPQMPSFPQTIDGVPVNVPGMPNGGQSANVPPGGAMGDPTDPTDPGDGSAPPDGLPGADGDDPADEEPDDSKPAFLKGSGLDEQHYMQHLALRFLPDRERVLARVRHENGVES